MKHTNYLEILRFWWQGAGSTLVCLRLMLEVVTLHAQYYPRHLISSMFCRFFLLKKISDASLCECKVFMNGLYTFCMLITTPWQLRHQVFTIRSICTCIYSNASLPPCLEILGNEQTTWFKSTSSILKVSFISIFFKASCALKLVWCTQPCT